VPLVLFALAGCGGSARDVAVQVSLPGPDSVAAPLPGVQVVAVPYDRDSIIASLEARAARPRPNTAILDTLFERFRGPFLAMTSAAATTARLRDSLAALRRALAERPKEHPRLKAADTLALARELAASRKELAARQAVLDRVRSEVQGPADSLRAALRAWEDSTYRGYDSITSGLMRQLDRQAVVDTTDAKGIATLRGLKPGDWWVYARTWNPDDPNVEWYWNVKVVGDTVRLDEHSAKKRPRY